MIFFSHPKADIFWREIVKRLMVSLLVAVPNEITDCLPKLPGVFSVPKLDFILIRSVVALNLSLGHAMVWRSSDLFNGPSLEIFLQLT